MGSLFPHGISLKEARAIIQGLGIAQPIRITAQPATAPITAVVVAPPPAMEKITMALSLNTNEKAALRIGVGDANGDKKADVTVEAVVQLPFLAQPVALGPVTQNVPVEQALAFASSMVSGAAIPALTNGVQFAVHMLRAALKI